MLNATTVFQLAFALGAGWALSGLLRDVLVSAINSTVSYIYAKKCQKRYKAEEN